MAYVWRNGAWRDKVTGKPMELPEGDVIASPMVISDLPPYLSPLGTGIIDGRKARREDLARHGCREIDPSEFKPEYYNAKFARKHGKKWTPPPAPSPKEIDIKPIVRG